MTDSDTGTDDRPERAAVIALGANLGDREATLRQAVAELDATDGIRVRAVSRHHSTVAITPHGADESAPGYLNAIALAATTLTPIELLDVVAGIETAHGRVRTERWGDRTLDLDIIDIEGVELESPRLTLPHPRAAERDFVLAPWLEIDADATLTGRGRVADLLADVQAGGGGA
ncbi:MAG: 2-amino-4-hydroxy-6-hydroxymethyldihydropteridine diphosphokinase [Microbacteriaceae bacterium]